MFKRTNQWTSRLAYEEQSDFGIDFEPRFLGQAGGGITFRSAAAPPAAEAVYAAACGCTMCSGSWSSGDTPSGNATPATGYASPFDFDLAPWLGGDIIAYSTPSTVPVAPLTVQTGTQYKDGVPTTRTDTVSDYTSLLWPTGDPNIPVYSINGVNGKPAYITYSFPTLKPDYVVANSDTIDPATGVRGQVTPESLAAFRGFSASEIQLVEAEMAKISAASGVVFLRVDSRLGEMPFWHIDFTKFTVPTAGGFAAAPGNGGTSLGASDVYMDANPITQVDVLLHEIGHALGLKHPHQSGGHATLGKMMDARYDNVANTIMSYENTAGTKLGPMDIQALRHLYGDQLPVAGTDYVWDQASETLTQFGTAGADLLYGTGANDTIDGGASNDMLVGKDGRNTLNGGDGNDTITGGAGENIFSGGLGDDTLKGGAGINTLSGNEGKDTIDGGTGANDIDGGSEDDTISFIATAGKAFRVEGGTGADALTIILGDSAPDVLTLAGAVTNVETINTTNFTGLPRTRAITITANDAGGRLTGGDGNDVINGANGTFVMAGGKGDDTIISNGNRGAIAGEAGNDILRIGAAGGDMFGGSGRDSLYANAAVGYMVGGLRDDGGATDGDMDTFYFARADYSVTGAVDSIGEFGAEDRIDLTGLNLTHYEIIANGEWSTIKGRQGATLFEVAVNARNLTTAQIIGDEGFSSNLNLVGTDAGEPLTGGLSDDRIEGRGGADRLTGGAGIDTFIVKDAAHSTAAAFDTITDFVRGTDTIDLTGLALTSYKVATVGGTSVITGVRNQNTPSETLFKLIVNTPGLTTDDILGDDPFGIDRVITGTPGDDNSGTTRLLGGIGNDTIYGLAGNDLINGMEGDDLIEGGAGADHLVGGNGNGVGNPQSDPTFGNDVFLYTNTSHSVEGASDYIQDFVIGEDKIRFQGISLTSYAITTVGTTTEITGLDGTTRFKIVVGRPGLTTADIEGDEGFGTDIVKDGTPVRDVLSGGTGNDTINGKGGDDELRGAAGKDTLRGDEGLDTLYGDAGDDTLEGGTERDVLWGGDDNDTLKGGAGNDQLAGDGGIDKLYGEADDDTLIVKVGAVRTGFVIDGGSGVDNLTVNFDDTSKPQTLALNTLGIVGVESVLVQGSGANDTLTANIAVSGKVTMNGWGGDDTLTGGASVDHLLGWDGNDTLSGGLGNDELFGGSGDDTLIGGAGNDVLKAEGGLDKLYGGADNDSLHMSIETLPGSIRPATVALEGGEGEDTLYLYAADRTVAHTFDLRLLTRTGIEKIELSGGIKNDTLTADATASVRLWGGEGADTLQGGSGGGDLNGELGNDVINGGSGSYRLGGGGDNDTITAQSNNGDLHGDEGNDTLIGGSGTGNLWGGTGDDLLVAGRAFSFMNGGADRDTYEFRSALDSTRASADIIDGFQSGADKIDLRKIVFTGAVTIDPVTYTFGDGTQIAGTEISGQTAAGELFIKVYGVVAQADVLTNAGQQLRKLADGYIAGATVYYDSNDNGQLDDGEDFSFTDELGNFELPSGGSGAIRGFGGINIDTGLPNLLQLSAPGDAVVVDPLTTLVQALIEGGETEADATAQVMAALGIDPSVVLGQTDLLAAAAGGDAGALAAQKIAASIANTIVTGAANAADGAQAAAAVLSALAGMIAASGGALDLTESDVLTDIYEQAGLGAAAAGAAASAAAGNDAIATATTLDDISVAQKEGALTGNDLDNVLTGGTGADALRGFGGDDRLDGGAGIDVLVGGTGNDVFVIETRGDRAVEAVGEGDDLVLSGINLTLGANLDRLTLTGAATYGVGNGLDNILTGNDAANRLNGGAGADEMAGGLGNDIYVIDDAGDRVIETADGGSDKVRTTIDYVLEENVENLILLGGAVRGTGNDAANRIMGGQANETLLGLGGDDMLVGRGGSDTLTGGEGRDTFRFVTGDLGASQAATDQITDFTVGTDRIDLRRFDAIDGTTAVDAFRFIGADAFTGAAGQLRFVVIGGETLVQGDTDGDGMADMVLRLTGAHGLTLTDFAGVTIETGGVPIV